MSKLEAGIDEKKEEPKKIEKLLAEKGIIREGTVNCEPIEIIIEDEASENEKIILKEVANALQEYSQANEAPACANEGLLYYLKDGKIHYGKVVFDEYSQDSDFSKVLEECGVDLWASSRRGISGGDRKKLREMNVYRYPGQIQDSQQKEAEEIKKMREHRDLRRIDEILLKLEELERTLFALAVESATGDFDPKKLVRFLEGEKNTMYDWGVAEKPGSSVPKQTILSLYKNFESNDKGSKEALRMKERLARLKILKKTGILPHVDL